MAANSVSSDPKHPAKLAHRRDPHCANGRASEHAGLDGPPGSRHSGARTADGGAAALPSCLHSVLHHLPTNDNQRQVRTLDVRALNPLPPSDADRKQKKIFQRIFLVRYCQN